MRILYVEDNDDNAVLLETRLTQAGHTVIVATDGAQGIEMAKATMPDLIIMDLRLPKMDGWEATRRLKAAPETRAIPVIALSSHAMPGDREKALAAGCDDYEPKPVDYARLRAKIAALAPTGGSG